MRFYTVADGKWHGAALFRRLEMPLKFVFQDDAAILTERRFMEETERAHVVRRQMIERFEPR